MPSARRWLPLYASAPAGSNKTTSWRGSFLWLSGCCHGPLTAELMLQAQSLPLGPLELGRLHRAELAIKEYRALEATLTYSRKSCSYWANPRVRSFGDDRRLQAIKGIQAKWSIVEAVLIQAPRIAEAVPTPLVLAHCGVQRAAVAAPAAGR